MSGPQSQREKLREKRKQAAKKRIATLVIVLSAVALAIFLIAMLPKLSLDKNQLYLQDGFSIGDPNAPVKVEEFSDFRCSHCQNFALNYEADFIEKYVDTGKVYLTFHNYAFQEGLIHAENVGGDIDKALNTRCIIGAFPWKYEGLESCPCRIVAFYDCGEEEVTTRGRFRG